MEISGVLEFNAVFVNVLVGAALSTLCESVCLPQGDQNTRQQVMHCTRI